MKKLVIEIEMKNLVFDEKEVGKEKGRDLKRYIGAEAAKILIQYAEEIEGLYFAPIDTLAQTLFDHNGDKIGTANIKEC